MTTTTATPDRVDAYEAKIDSDEVFKTAVRVAAANRYIGCQGMRPPQGGCYSVVHRTDGGPGDPEGGATCPLVEPQTT